MSGKHRKGRARPGKLPNRPLAAAILMALSPCVPAWSATLPVVCVAGSCGQGNPSSWLGSGQATATSVGNTLTINQTSEQAVLNWASFNVSADGKVIFKQPNSSAIALNEIFQASPSQIFGLVQANGQIYLINQNGIIFGATATVNTGGLLASTLQLSPSAVTGGLLAPLNASLPALVADGRKSVIDAAGNPVLGPDGQPLAVQILVQPGAKISTSGDGNRILLAAQSVQNDGSLNAPDGQVVLAAGQSVFLQASTDPNLRGLVVEVDGGGLASNLAQGSISVGEGNATLVGLAVNQQGRISATTSVSENGSIKLLARDTVNIESILSVNELFASHGGTLTLGPGSVTSVMPDLASTATAIDAQAQPQSQITLSGQQVDLMSGSSVIAPSGQVSITASANPSEANSNKSPDPDAHLRIDAGATIDVSGSSVSVPVTQNLVAVQLRGSELADSPLQRNGPLRGQTVIVDARVGTPVANVAADIALIQRGVLQRTTAGGSIDLDSGGDVVVAQGATLNVSGGAVTFTPGIMQTTQLIKPDGSLVDIGSASPNQVYAGIANPSYRAVSDQWGTIQIIPTPGIAHNDPGYVQGSSAGSLQILGSTLVLDGNFLGQVTNGIYQRSGAGVALGGALSIGTNAADFRAPTIELVPQAPVEVISSSASLPSDLPLQLPVSVLTDGGFSRITLASNERISIPAGLSLDLPAGGSLSLFAPQIDVGSSLKVPSGTIQLTTAPSFSTVLGAPGSGISVADGVALDVSGLWVNDKLVATGTTPAGPAAINGGSVSLYQGVFEGTLSLGSEVQLLANGGAQLPRSGALSPGSGGSISIIESPGGTLQVGNGDVVSGFGVDGARGGSFGLEAPRIAISSGDSTWLRAQRVAADPVAGQALQLDASLFSSDGFSSFTLTADAGRPTLGTSDVLSVAPGTSINLAASTLILSADAAQQPSGGELADFSSAVLLPQYQRLPSQLTLQAAPGGITSSEIGNLTVAAGARITADPGSSITLASVGSLNLNGVINDPSGKVSLQILNPPAAADPGFVPDLGIEVGPQAQIDVAGSVIYQPSDTGLLKGTVLPGGSVTLNAARGTLVTDFGSLIDFSGTQGALDVPSAANATTTQRQTVASAAGSLSLSSTESISLLGDYHGAAGVGTTGLAQGGTLNISLSNVSLPEGSGFPVVPTVITVQPGALTTPLSPKSGSAVLDNAQLLESGVDSLTLTADNAVRFINGTQLNLARSVVLTAPVISVAPNSSASVSAPYIALGTASSPETPASATPGNGAISFSGSEVDLSGSLAFQGVGQANIVSSGEIRLLGETINSSNLGNLAIAGDLTLKAARVVPTTDVNFTITAAGGNTDLVQFEANGTLSGTPLSVAGQLTVNAADIVQAGTVVAPFGQITFNAGNSLTLAPGSLTSVSGAGSILPFGTVQNGNAWVYQASLNQVLPTPVTALPNRQVTLNSAKVTVASGATVDVSGGGDLNGYGFETGTGGTQDVLSALSSPGLYAVLPSLAGQTAPYDPMMWANSGIAPNQSIYLSGGGGLAAGLYPLLPARYALLPGAFLVSVASGFQGVAPAHGAQSGAGFPIVSGYFTYGNTGIGDTRQSGFLIEPGSYARVLGGYTDNYASNFFAPNSVGAATGSAAGAVPADAGTLVVAVTAQLDALGKVNAAPAAGGEGATIEIVAPQIEVDPSLAGSGTVPGQIHLSSEVIDTWNAGRIWFGAQMGPNGSAVVTANSVQLTAGSSLSADEVVLAATGSVQIDAGASVTTPSTQNAALKPVSAAGTASPLSLDGPSANAAVLAVSDLNFWTLDRGSGAAGSPGTLNVAPGATVASRGALTLDAPGGGTLGDGALTGAGASWSIAAGNLAFTPQAAVLNGYAIDGDLVGALQKAGSVHLTSGGAIDLEQTVNLGASSVSVIGITAPGINNLAGAGSSSFSAAQIQLAGGSAASPALQTGQGSLTFNAGEIDIQGGHVGLAGFSRTTFNAADVIAGTGVGSVASAGDVYLVTPVLTVQSGGDTQLSAGGALMLTAPAPSAPQPTFTPSLTTGGILSLAGDTVADSTLINMPSGEVAISAAHQLAVGPGGSINVAGLQPSNATHGSDGGLISLGAGSDLTVALGVNLNVAAGNGANAGAIDVNAAGSADFEATVNGSSLAGTRSGAFSLQAGSLANFAALNDSLESSGFHYLRAISVGTGDLNLAAGSSITAQTVVLTTDAGNINIAGNINASNPTGGGNIALSAHDDLVLSATANVSANGALGGKGGEIELASIAGAVRLDAASQVSANGSNDTGLLIVRAASSSEGNDFNLAGLPSDLTHIGTVALEPMLAYNVSAAPTANDFDSIQSNMANYMTAASPVILNRLGLNGVSNVDLRPYADISSPGDLTLGSINFSAWRFLGQPADISIRAGGNLTVSGTVSDGFGTPHGFLDMLGGASSRISLVAGADFQSASATAVTAESGADLTLQSGAILRTGTGGLEVTAARDVIFGDGASIYTGGIPGAPAKTNTDTGVPISFPTAGGDIRITAGRDVVAVPVSQAVDQWNPRFQPTNNGPAIWGINFGEFQWNVGALGGGTVNITAGRNVDDVSAAVADSRTFSAPRGGSSLAFGGGDLNIFSGADVLSSQFYVGNGIGRINAGGALSSDLLDSSNRPIGTLLLAGDASFYVSAQRDVFLDGMVSETALQPGTNSDSLYFFRYDPNSTLALQSRGGSIAYSSGYIGEFMGSDAGNTDLGAFVLAPPSLDIASFGGDVIFNATTEALSSPSGQMHVYAARDITSSGVVLGMIDVPLSQIATADAPSNLSGYDFLTAVSYTGGSLHQNDAIPITIAAGRDIGSIEFDLAKQADISAGRNISDLTFAGQNLNPNDVTYVRAGGNIGYTPDDISAHLTLAGPGQFDIIAGGNVDLGVTQGITTYGNILNPNLVSSTGASITVLAGLGAPIGVGGSAATKDFVSTVIAPSTQNEAALVGYVEQQTGESNLTFASAAPIFRNFGLAQQLPLIDDIFFSELVLSGTEANQVPSLGFTRGYTAIDSLFPSSRTPQTPYSGNVSLGYSRIYTLDGGSISLLVPGGSVDVGLANPPANFAALDIVRQPSDLGIVAVGTGDVNIFSLGDVLVNQSRVFTLGGGNIAIWSTTGNIDAGNGAKSSLSAPPPTIEVDSNGNVTLDFSGAIAGSGIRTIQSVPTVGAGDVSLIAPVGFVNAGDAGIGSAGNINIAAQRVIGANNINFGGSATGVPPEVSGIGAALSGASSVANSATTAAAGAVDSGSQSASAAPLAAAAFGWLDVFVEGFGEEVCKANDLECLKRNHKP